MQCLGSALVKWLNNTADIYQTLDQLSYTHLKHVKLSWHVVGSIYKLFQIRDDKNDCIFGHQSTKTKRSLKKKQTKQLIKSYKTSKRYHSGRTTSFEERSSIIGFPVYVDLSLHIYEIRFWILTKDFKWHITFGCSIWNKTYSVYTCHSMFQYYHSL